MRRRLWVLPLLAAGLLILFKAVPLVSVDGFRSQVEQNIPRGTPMAEAEAWLRANGYPCHYVVDSAGRRHGLCGGFQNYLADRVGVSFFPTTLYYELRFDGDERMTDNILVVEHTVNL